MKTISDIGSTAVNTSSLPAGMIKDELDLQGLEADQLLWIAGGENAVVW